MRIIYILSCFFCTIGWINLNAQDVHFTRFYDAPIQLNPAKTGDYLGTFRLGGIFRDQNYNLSNVYLTPAAYLDAPILKGFRDNHWVGAGLSLMQDRAGLAGVRNSNITGALAYHIGVNKDMTSYFTVGASYGLYSREVADKTKLIFEDELITNGSSEDLAKISDEKVNYSDVGAGVQFTGGLNDGGQLRIGFAMHHLTRPRVTLVTGTGDSRLPMRVNAYATADAVLNEKIDLIPALYFSTMDGHRDVSAQLAAGLKLNPLTGTRIIGGLGYRFGDALEILGGLDIKGTRIGLAYDLTTNPIKPTGGFEVAISHIFMLYKKPKDNPIILCPRL